jgi:endonuclease G
MKKLFLLILLPFWVNAQPGNPSFEFEKLVDFILPDHSDSDVVVRHDGYTLRFQDAYKVADWVAYPLLPEEINGQAVREGSTFRPDPDVPTGSALPIDYTASGYDRGHLAPAGDFHFSKSMMQQTFFMSNMTPQLPAFNRGIWKQLESLVRGWGIRDNGLYVVTGPVLKPGLPTIGRVNQVAVPEQFYKVILYCHAPDIRMIGFLIRNEESHEPLTSFVVPVYDIEAVTGIDFFPLIPIDLQDKLKKTPTDVAISQWFF